MGDNADWEVGVLADSYQRKGHGGGQLFALAFYEGKYTAVSRPCGGDADVDLALTHRPQRIRVRLDWDEGRLSFFDSDTSALVHAFPEHVFTHPLFPYVNTSDHTLPLKMLPVPGSVVQYFVRY